MKSVWYSRASSRVSKTHLVTPQDCSHSDKVKSMHPINFHDPLGTVSPLYFGNHHNDTNYLVMLMHCIKCCFLLLTSSRYLDFGEIIFCFFLSQKQVYEKFYSMVSHMDVAKCCKLCCNCRSINARH